MSLNFASDNTGPIHPLIFDALAKANEGSAMPYGADTQMERVREELRRLFDTPEAEVLLVSTGTAANALSLAALCAPYQTVLCHRMSHIEEDECGAPEFFTGGAKLTLIDGDEARMEPDALTRVAGTLGAKGVHGVQKGALSLTNVTEAGTLYSIEAQGALTGSAKSFDLSTHLDGARFANACAALSCTAAQLGDGFDVISFGGTKNGCMGVEAIVIKDPKRAWELELRRKRAGHLWSKHRFLSAQMSAYLEGDLWLELAQMANARGQQLAQGLSQIAEAEFLFTPQANMIFVRLPRALHARAMEAGATYYLMDGTLEGPAEAPVLCRLVCDWSKTEADVDRLLALYASA